MVEINLAPIALIHDPNKLRPLIVGDDNKLDEIYPIYLNGWVERGFGRGSKELGCPTANLPESSIEPYSTTLKTGVHYGFAKVIDPINNKEDSIVLPMVMSIGWNPFYKNTRRTAEVHVLHDFGKDFYGKELRVIILGFIRPELDYAGMDALIKDINTDKQVSLNCVNRPFYQTYKNDPFFTAPCTLPPIDLSTQEKKVAPPTASSEGGGGEGKL